MKTDKWSNPWLRDDNSLMNIKNKPIPVSPGDSFENKKS